MTSETALWHVTVTVGGESQDPSKTHAALLRLIGQRPFIHSIRYSDALAELKYWEESIDMVDAASLALRMWNEHRTSADLPEWKVVGLEVVHQETYQARGMGAAMNVGAVLPTRF